MKRRTFIATVLTALPAAGQVVPYTFSDPQIYRSGGAHGLPTCDSYDDMESYSVAADVNGLNGGPCWFGAYVDNYPYFGLGTEDDMESYTVSASLNGLERWLGLRFSSGVGLTTANDFLVQDDMESYTVTAALNGLNGGAASSPVLGWGLRGQIIMASTIQSQTIGGISDQCIALSASQFGRAAWVWGQLEYPAHCDRYAVEDTWRTLTGDVAIRPMPRHNQHAGRCDDRQFIWAQVSTPACNATRGRR